MTRNELIEKLSKVTLIGEGRIVIKEVCYKGNSLAPESKAWSVCYPDVDGSRRKATYWNEAFGFQWSY